MIDSGSIVASSIFSHNENKIHLRLSFLESDKKSTLPTTVFSVCLSLASLSSSLHCSVVQTRTHRTQDGKEDGKKMFVLFRQLLQEAKLSKHIEIFKFLALTSYQNHHTHCIEGYVLLRASS